MAALSSLLPPGNVVVSQVIDYNNRTQLRSITPASGELAMARVKGLGIFFWYPGSTDIDDGETCFAATGGRWILEAINWDFVDAQMPPVPKVRRETFTNTIRTVGSNQSISFTVPIIGATPSSTIIATPPGDAPFSSPDAGSGNKVATFSTYAYCVVPDQVVVIVSNSYTSSITLPTGNWVISVID